MYLWKTDAQSATSQGRFVADGNSQAARKAAAADSLSNCRIGVVISDDCSSSDVAKVLARTCDHFGAERGPANKVGKFSITIIAGRTGFVLRENACLPVWCEAICDVDPLQFHYFVVPKSGKGTMDPRPEVVEWLARAGASGKIIVLSLEADAAQESKSEALADPQAKPQAPEAGVVREADQSESEEEETSADSAGEVTRSSDASQAGSVFDKPAPSERIKATVAWLNENYGSRVSISNMAEHALMSERNFLRRFRAEMGHTPHEYLSQVRLESARQLLVTTALPVDKIARHCGLFNGDHLRKHFLKRFGMSPAEYRAARFNALHALGSAGANADPELDPDPDPDR
ncbi:helix-turn-helix domain-containing protein [Trinickia sp.]|uniref:helix-turn-helix domain-containing protein n=1 Tax=Trinickia sp. TaxID=2571163 RepID=UPI003F7DCF54